MYTDRGKADSPGLQTREPHVMTISFSCPSCQTKLKAKDKNAGRKTTCPHCHYPVTVPVDSFDLGAIDDDLSQKAPELWEGEPDFPRSKPYVPPHEPEKPKEDSQVALTPKPYPVATPALLKKMLGSDLENSKSKPNRMTSLAVFGYSFLYALGFGAFGAVLGMLLASAKGPDIRRTISEFEAAKLDAAIIGFMVAFVPGLIVGAIIGAAAVIVNAIDEK